MPSSRFFCSKFFLPCSGAFSYLLPVCEVELFFFLFPSSFWGLVSNIFFLFFSALGCRIFFFFFCLWSWVFFSFRCFLFSPHLSIFRVSSVLFPSCFFSSDSFQLFISNFLMCWILLSVSNFLLVSLLFIGRFLDSLDLNSGSKSCHVVMNWPSTPNRINAV